MDDGGETHIITGNTVLFLYTFFYARRSIVNFIVDGSPEKLSCECDAGESVATLRETLSTAWRISLESVVLSYNG